MNRSLLRGVALIVVLGLLVDPRLAAAFSNSDLESCQHFPVVSFEQQALTLSVLEVRRSFDATAWRIQRWTSERQAIVSPGALGLIWRRPLIRLMDRFGPLKGAFFTFSAAALAESLYVAYFVRLTPAPFQTAITIAAISLVAHAWFGILVPTERGGWRIVRWTQRRAPPVGFFGSYLFANAAALSSLIAVWPTFRHGSLPLYLLVSVLPHLLLNAAYAFIAQRSDPVEEEFPALAETVSHLIGRFPELSQQSQDVIRGRLPFNHLSYDDQYHVQKNLDSIFLDFYWRQKVTDMERCLIALRLVELRVELYFSITCVQGSVDLIKKDPKLARWARLIIADRLREARQRYYMETMNGRPQDSPITYYEILAGLLDLPFRLLTNEHWMNRYIAIPIEGTIRLDQLIKDTVGERKGRAYKTLDIGSRPGLVPLYVRKVAAPWVDPTQKNLYLGTETPDGWSQRQGVASGETERAGLRVTDDPHQVREGAWILLQPDPAKLRTPFDLITWFRPPVKDRRAYKAARSLAKIVGPHSKALFSFIDQDYLPVLSPMIRSLRGRLPFRMRLVSLGSNIGNSFEGSSLESKLNSADLLDPRAAPASFREGHTDHVLIEFGESDQLADLYQSIEPRALTVVDRILETEAKRSDIDRAAQLREVQQRLRTAPSRLIAPRDLSFNGERGIGTVPFLLTIFVCALPFLFYFRPWTTVTILALSGAIMGVAHILRRNAERPQTALIRTGDQPTVGVGSRMRDAAAVLYHRLSWTLTPQAVVQLMAAPLIWIHHRVVESAESVQAPSRLTTRWFTREGRIRMAAEYLRKYSFVLPSGGPEGIQAIEAWWRDQVAMDQLRSVITDPRALRLAVAIRVAWVDGKRDMSVAHDLYWFALGQDEAAPEPSENYFRAMDRSKISRQESRALWDRAKEFYEQGQNPLRPERLWKTRSLAIFNQLTDFLGADRGIFQAFGEVVDKIQILGRHGGQFELSWSGGDGDLHFQLEIPFIAGKQRGRDFNIFFRFNKVIVKGFVSSLDPGHTPGGGQKWRQQVLEVDTPSLRRLGVGADQFEAFVSQKTLDVLTGLDPELLKVLPVKFVLDSKPADTQGPLVEAAGPSVERPAPSPVQIEQVIRDYKAFVLHDLQAAGVGPRDLTIYRRWYLRHIDPTVWRIDLAVLRPPENIRASVRRIDKIASDAFQEATRSVADLHGIAIRQPLMHALQRRAFESLAEVEKKLHLVTAKSLLMAA